MSISKLLLAAGVVGCAFAARPAAAVNVSMGCVERYSDASGFTTDDNVSLTCDAASGFYGLFNFWGGNALRRFWQNTLVWPTDYREDSFGGSDSIEADWSSADLHVFSGHGSCQNPPVSTSPDFLVTARNGIGRNANFVNIGSSLRLGEFPGSGVFGSNGNLNALMINASCPMDLVSLTTQWWPVFQGLHVAMGHSGDVSHDNLDSPTKLPTVGMWLGLLGGPSGSVSYRTAWMNAGLIDVQDGVCAVITGTGRTEAEAISRRDAETPKQRIGDALPATWIAWRWTCK
ncbi:DUF6345 domain-containing protein [Derxia gummosa]|uniref:DUF6345 domain-containing protein n=1 Tax=Derxia gummosa DSM 723 TaxID=1121388 RepID=A0A8B6X4T3_9BURK|nr:DUF6345 domain-containing protein [Derxia gummosa]